MFIFSETISESLSRGSIVNISTIGSSRAFDVSLYCASKAAIDQITRCMAVELGPHQIRVNAIQPTLVAETAIGQEVISALGEEPFEVLRQRTPNQRFAKVEDIVNLILYLLSEASDMVNGAIIPVDGGRPLL